MESTFLLVMIRRYNVITQCLWEELNLILWMLTNNAELRVKTKENKFYKKRWIKEFRIRHKTDLHGKGTKSKHNIILLSHKYDQIQNLCI